jgi:hypothetical protein
MNFRLTQIWAKAVKRNMIFFLVMLISTESFSQYNVTEIITDYGGYWKSSAASNNPIKPDNSHNLVSFSFNGNRYSTGVSDSLLTAQRQTFIPGDYRALPVTSLGSAPTSNTKIGLGYMYDGVANGPSSPAPLNNIPYYLTDGIKGLNLGTCVANLPAGTLYFPISKIIDSSINDGIPDILITQIADPSGSQDRYEFTDILGNVVGNYVDIMLTNIPPVGNWTADFYEASQNPMTLAAGFTRTDRPIRLWATDLSSFGINSTNAANVAYFKIILSGNSDVAFVSYNNNAINIFNSLLPVKLNDFSGQQINKEVQLNWETGSEINSDAFIVERSSDGNLFTSIDNIKATNGSNVVAEYNSIDKNPLAGKNYYRLKMMDKDGNSEYSKVVIINYASTNVMSTINFYPNPARDHISVSHPYAGSNEQFQIISLQGNILLQQKIVPASFQTKIALPVLPKGMYQLVWTNGKDISAINLLIQ